MSFDHSQESQRKNFGHKLAFSIFWLILLVGNPSSESLKPVFLLLNNKYFETRPNQPYNTKVYFRAFQPPNRCSMAKV